MATLPIKYPDGHHIVDDDFLKVVYWHCTREDCHLLRLLAEEGENEKGPSWSDYGYSKNSAGDFLKFGDECWKGIPVNLMVFIYMRLRRGGKYKHAENVNSFDHSVHRLGEKRIEEYHYAWRILRAMFSNTIQPDEPSIKAFREACSESNLNH